MTMRPINHPFAAESAANNLWDFDGIVGHPTTLRMCLLRRPDAHPAWHDYVVCLVHLRSAEGFPPAHKHRADCSHELMLWACDPDAEASPKDVNSYRILTPSNLIYQPAALTDSQALRVFSRFVAALSRGDLSPDTDARSMQKVLLHRLCEQVRKES